METLPYQILDGLDQHLSNLSIEADNPLKCYEKSVLYLVQINQDLKADIVSRDFITKKDEIYFFKHIKPQLTSKLIYFNKLYRIEPQIWGLSINKLQEFYKRELLKLQMFFEDNKDFYNYYKMKHSHLDKFYFRRYKHNIRLNLDSYLIDSDPLFSTSHVHKLAQIIANEALKIHFESQMHPKDESEELLEEIIGNSGLIWTASPRDLIELIQGLHCTGVFNYGKVSLTLIKQMLEKAFHIKLGNIYDEFSAIKERNGDPLHFLNRMKRELFRKIGIGI